MSREESFDKIGRPAHVCLRCEAGFDDGDIFHSAIFRGEEGFVRQDFCGACWGELEEVPLAVWKSRRADSEPPPPPPPDGALLLELLGRLVQEAKREDEAFVYLLALYLMRRKVVVLESTEGEGEERQLRLGPGRGFDDVQLSIRERRFTGEEMDRAEVECERLISGEVGANSA
ncbi:MAG: hypothetical protein QF752_07965 [Planctomycetota bacterium]|jgi:hypothetical protein|nr:hypothetical protein [Planctomycetota bacterium]